MTAGRVAEGRPAAHRLAWILLIASTLAVTVHPAVGLTVLAVGLIIGTRTGRRTVELSVITAAATRLWHRERENHR